MLYNLHSFPSPSPPLGVKHVWSGQIHAYYFVNWVIFITRFFSSFLRWSLACIEMLKYVTCIGSHFEKCWKILKEMQFSDRKRIGNCSLLRLSNYIRIVKLFSRTVLFWFPYIGHDCLEDRIEKRVPLIDLWMEVIMWSLNSVLYKQFKESYPLVFMTGFVGSFFFAAQIRSCLVVHGLVSSCWLLQGREHSVHPCTRGSKKLPSSQPSQTGGEKIVQFLIFFERPGRQLEKVSQLEWKNTILKLETV